MTNIVAFSKNPVPSDDVANEFGLELYAAKMDPSDPDTCLEYLFDLHRDRFRDVIANLDGACYAAGQLNIAAEMARAN